MLENEKDSNIFVMTNLTEEAEDLDEIENMDLEALQECINKDIAYKAIVQAIKGNVNVKKLHKDHPVSVWAGIWEHISLLTMDRPVVMDSERILMLQGMRIESAITLHGLTHGSGPKMIATLSKYMYWQGYKADIQQVADACEVCNSLLPSQ